MVARDPALGLVTPLPRPSSQWARVWQLAAGLPNLALVALARALAWLRLCLHRLARRAWRRGGSGGDGGGGRSRGTGGSSGGSSGKGTDVDVGTDADVDADAADTEFARGTMAGLRVVVWLCHLPLLGALLTRLNVWLVRTFLWMSLGRRRTEFTPKRLPAATSV